MVVFHSFLWSKPTFAVSGVGGTGVGLHGGWRGNSAYVAIGAYSVVAGAPSLYASPKAAGARTRLATSERPIMMAQKSPKVEKITMSLEDPMTRVPFVGAGCLSYIS